MIADALHSIADDSWHLSLALAVIAFIALVGHQVAVVGSSSRTMTRWWRLASVMLTVLTLADILLRFKVLAS